MNTTGGLDLGLVRLAFGRQVGRVAVEDVDVLRQDVDVLEKVVPHKKMVRLRVIPRQVDVFVHVERSNVAERNPALDFYLKLPKINVEDETDE